ncbi:hexokinase [Cylindrobasidium torrendii FP15055 ss-10]|uniref:Phosphotransferase n=1 Tax=Cylindrobasidium torrendii FP15055 ss-10 TaxID=1314674 RepID=A0A0D7BRL3_9AGAR|nr:hexokinase [Cylindrobasidium torrendii FP15055 ss-10]
MSATSAHFYRDPQSVLDDIGAQFHLGSDTLGSIAEAFIEEYRQGLAGYGKPMAMIPTFVTGVPDGTETGTFLALDLGGTNLRVCQVVLNGDKTFSLSQQKYKVSDALKTGEATALFDYLADSVDAFLTSNAEKDTSASGLNQPDVLPLGLTFSFPVEQTALDSGKILTWTKGFAAKHAVGNDVVQLLQNAFNRKHMHVKCVALVNDTVGAMLSRAYTSGGCTLGAIFGTGTNGAYVEQVENITKLGNNPAVAKGGVMVVNTEWGAFNNSRSHLPSTPYDMTLDRQSINPGFQAFEKFISGMYLGEITRLVLLSLIDAAPKPILFGGKSSSILDKQWGLDSSVMSDIETAWESVGVTSNPTPKFNDWDDNKLDHNVKSKLDRVWAVVVSGMGVSADHVSLRDASIVKWICSLVAKRAARLSSVAVAATMLQTGRATLVKGDTSHPSATSTEEIKIGVDGSLIQFYPHFEDMVREGLRYLVGEGVEGRIEIGLAKDGSGVGAALCALQATKQI